MAPDLLIGVDVGTTGTKSMVVDTDGTIVAVAYTAYALDRPRAFVVEQSADAWWQAIVSTIRTCLKDVDPARIRAMALSYQGGSVVAVDADGNPLSPARSWLDRRADRQVSRLADRFGEDGFFRLTGWRLYGAYNCVQLLDMRHSEPELFASADGFLGTGEFLNGKLTGRRVADLNGMGITQLLDVESGTWSEEILDFIGIDSGRLAELVVPGTPIGTLTQAAADELGLSPDVLVVAGGHDQYCAALGAGVTSPGDVLLSTGTAWVVLGITAGALPDPNRNFGFGRHVVPGMWGEFGSFRNGGVCLDWARNLLGGAGGDDYASINAFAESAAPGAAGLRFFPHFDGTNIPTWVDEAQGSFLGVELRHGRPEFYRGVMEGVACEARRVLESYQSFGPEASKVTLLGGAARSAVWSQIVADVLPCPVEIAEVVDSACVGAAALAGSGAGFWGDPSAASRALTPPARAVPVDEHGQLYDALYSEYQDSSTALMDIYRRKSAR